MNNFSHRWGKKGEPADEKPVSEVTLLALVVSVMSAVVSEAGKEYEEATGVVPSADCAAALALLPSPSSDFSPEQVVKIQLSALKLNDLAGHDSGVEKVYEYASAANVEMTATPENFRNLMKSPVYRPLVGFTQVEFEPIRCDGHSAEQSVLVTPANGAAPVKYTFLLMREMFGEKAGCWLVDGIARG